MSDLRRLTRRDVLQGVAVVGAGALLGPGTAGAAEGPVAAAGPAAAAGSAAAGGRVFAHSVGTLAAGASPVIVARRPFCLAAVRWSAPAHARIELRARRADGRWGPWGIASSQGHAGDGVTPSDQVGEGLWTGAATAVQLRGHEPVRGVALQFVAAEPALTANESANGASAPALAGPALPAGPGQPPIIARRVWAGGDHRPTHGPLYGAIDMGIVHHTENPNGYSPSEVPALLRAIYAFHVFGRGWWDIGYNFLVDRFGRIWEGRQGGVDQPVIGAQAGDWNGISFGVAVLGTFTAVAPPPAALAALQRLLAWKMSLHGQPVLGQIAAVVDPAGVVYTQFRPNERVRLPRIAGHRDVDSTACPGDALYARLPSMRPRIARLAGVPALLTLDAQIGEVVTGPSLTLAGRLTRRGGAPLAGAPVAIRAVGQPAPLATVTTAADGRFATTLTPRGSMVLEAVHAARPAAISPLVAVQRG